MNYYGKLQYTIKKLKRSNRVLTDLVQDMYTLLAHTAGDVILLDEERCELELTLHSRLTTAGIFNTPKDRI